MTELEIEVMRYVYTMREEFMKAEGVGKVGCRYCEVEKKGGGGGLGGGGDERRQEPAVWNN